VGASEARHPAPLGAVLRAALTTSPPRPLEGAGRPSLETALRLGKDIGPVAPARTVTFSLGLAGRDAGGLRRLLRALRQSHQRRATRRRRLQLPGGATGWRAGDAAKDLAGAALDPRRRDGGRPGGVITIVAVEAKPGLRPCHFSCSSQHGPPLIGNTVYANARFAFSIEYLAGSTTIVSSDADGVVFNVNGSAQIQFTRSAGTDLDAAIQTAFNSIDTNIFQDLQPVGAVRGAEIGLVLGKGTAYRGNYVPPGEVRASPSPRS
jgi:hypothetical protein